MGRRPLPSSDEKPMPTHTDSQEVARYYGREPATLKLQTEEGGLGTNGHRGYL